MITVPPTLKTIDLRKYVHVDRFEPLRKEGGSIQPLIISLFAGTGGSSLGYKNAGFKEILAIDNDDHAEECFKQNFPEVPMEKWDIDKLSATDILNRLGMKPGELDCFDASSSCVNLSRSNTRAQLYAVSNLLLLKMAQFVAEIQPKTFLFENVPGLLAPKNKALFLELQRRLNMLNYVWDYKVAKAEEYGVPQSRRRVLLMGVRTDVYRKSLNKNLFPEPCLTGIDNLALSKVLPHVMGYSPGQFADKFCYGNKPVGTITKTSSLWLYGQDGIRRKPTIEELKILSSFPLDFILSGAFSKQWARIGNAVPPKLIEAFARHLKNNFLLPYLLAENNYQYMYDRIENNSNHFRINGFREYLKVSENSDRLAIAV